MPKQATDVDYSALNRISDAVRRGNPSPVDREITLLRNAIEPLREQIALRKGAHWRGHIEHRPFVKALSFLADAEYLRGRFDLAHEIASGATNSLRDTLLKTRDPVCGYDQQRLRRQQVWLVLCDAAASIRRGQIVHASGLLEEAKAFVGRCLESKDFPCYGTHARIEFYQGLLARNRGQLGRARSCFDRAAEMADARCRQALIRTEKGPDYLQSERLFKTRCLARLQAFGYGLSSFSEGRFLSARASFYFALELLRNPTATDADHEYHDMLMANEVTLWLILVRTLLVSNDSDGVRQLGAMELEVRQLIGWFESQPGDFEPDRFLAAATLSLIGLRLRQFQGKKLQFDPVENRPERRPAPALRGGAPIPHIWEKDLTALITKLVRIWIAIDSDPEVAVALVKTVNIEEIEIPFWCNEVHLAHAEARIEANALRLARTENGECAALQEAILRAMRLPSGVTSELTRGQRRFADILNARGYYFLGTCGTSATSESQIGSWRSLAASIALRLKHEVARSGILAWKIQRLPSADLPEPLPMPNEVGYPAPHIDLTRLIAGRNAIVACIASNAHLNPPKMAIYLHATIGLTRDLARNYFDLFPELRKWLLPKGTTRQGAQTDQALVEEYLHFLHTHTPPVERNWRKSSSPNGRKTL